MRRRARLVITVDHGTTPKVVVDAPSEEQRVFLIAELLSRPVVQEISDAVQAALARLCAPEEIERSVRAEADEQAAEAAGDTVIPNGKHYGRTLADVVAEPRGEGWLKWVLKQPDHPVYREAVRYAAVFLPGALCEAMNERQLS